MSVQIHIGDCRDVLKTLPAESVQCCVTSPPYFGLRDYDVDGQMGLEETPEAFIAGMVAVFDEVRRVLRNDGTLWLNIGDSYAVSWGAQGHRESSTNDGRLSRNQINNHPKRGTRTGAIAAAGVKPKDMYGIPWKLATALRDQRYIGRMKAERDRVWLAAIVDGEGSISGYEHTRRDDGSERTGLNICVTNTNADLLDECSRIWPASTHNHTPHGEGHLGKRRVDRWIPQGAAEKMLLLQELYPYLIAKKKQAVVGWNLALAITNGKRDGHSVGAEAAREKRVALVRLLRALNAGNPVDLPDWLLTPPTCMQPGWYLRQDIIWHKPNPMPESVRDRCTKAHEYLFLLSKSERYYYDADAIREQLLESTEKRIAQNVARQAGSNRVPGKTNGPMKAVVRGSGMRSNDPESLGLTRGTTNQCCAHDGGANKRSVWTVPTQPFKEAHFATFPPDLIVPCIKAGCPIDGTVIDPFSGAGTTGLVADRLQRHAVLIELNPKYADIARRRIAGDAPLFSDVA
jgi:DNA modification methylase